MSHWFILVLLSVSIPSPSCSTDYQVSNPSVISSHMDRTTLIHDALSPQLLESCKNLLPVPHFYSDLLYPSPPSSWHGLPMQMRNYKFLKGFPFLLTLYSMSYNTSNLRSGPSPFSSLTSHLSPRHVLLSRDNSFTSINTSMNFSLPGLSSRSWSALILALCLVNSYL